MSDCSGVATAAVAHLLAVAVVQGASQQHETQAPLVVASVTTR